MKTFKQYLDERCWTGYKPVAGKKAFSKGSCVKEDGAMGASAGPANVVGSGAIAGTGGKGGEPGVSKKKKNPIMMAMVKRKSVK
jgi:hypothetical protein